MTRITPRSLLNQARSLDQMPAVQAGLANSLAVGSEGGKAITGAEAQQIIQQAQRLPKDQLRDLKSEMLQALTAQDHWECTADARSAFATFLGVPPEKLPAAVELKPGMNAMSRKVQNEAAPSSVPKREFAEIMKSMDGMPDELRRTVTASILGMQKDGRLKLDADSRKLLTRGVVEAYGDQGPEPYLDYRANSDLHTGAAGSYLSEVLASGGSFEEILFAFLLLMADKAEKKALEKMEELARIEEGNRDGRPGTRPPHDGPSAPGTDTTDKPDKPGQLGQGGDVKQVARTLEAMVQSAHWATTDKSDGGSQVTASEVDRLVGYLGRLPENVQKVLGSSFERVLQVGMPMTGEAHAAVKGWCEKTLGRPLDLSKAPKPGENHWQDSAVCTELRNSKKLEDQIAFFVVNTLYQPDKQLKEKMAPFKSLRDQMSSMAMAEQTAAPTPAKPDDVGAQLDAAKKAIDGGQQPPATSKPGRGKPNLAAATTPADQGTGADKPSTPAAAGGSKKSRSATGPQRDPALKAKLLDQIQSQPEPQPDKANDEISQYFDGDPRHAGPSGKSDVRAQHELQIAINERQRVFEMLSNMMKAIHEMQMTSIRNLR